MGSCAKPRGAVPGDCPSGTGARARWLLPLAAAWLLQAACIGVSAAPTPSLRASVETELAESGLAMEVEADPASPYLQSRVRYRVRILARVPLRQATLSEPSAEQAIIRRIGQDRRFDLEREGVRHRVLERLYAVVPQRSGPLRIVAPRLSAAVPVASMPGEERAQAGLDALLERLETVTRTGPTLLLDVRAIPDTAELPWLAAESVSISERWEPSDARVRVGESITRSITIEASGLIGASIPELPVESPRGLRTYPQTAEVSEQVSGDDLVVTARISRSYVPTLAGELELPAVRLSWWSIGMDEPREASLPARRLRVEEAPSPAVVDGDQHARAEFLRNAAADLWGEQWLAVLFALAWLTTLLMWLRERGRRRPGDLPKDTGTAGEAGARGAHDQVLRFKRACTAADARAARAALIDWGRIRWPHRAPSGPLGLMERLDADPNAVRAALAIEQGLYGRQALGWDGKPALAAITPLLEAVQRRPAAGQPALPPLYPMSAERDPQPSAGRRGDAHKGEARSREA